MTSNIDIYMSMITTMFHTLSVVVANVCIMNMILRDNRAVDIKWQCCIMCLISVVIGTLLSLTRALPVG